MAATTQPTFLRATLRPVYLQEAEWLALRDLTGGLGQQVENATQAFLGRECAWAGSLYEQRLRNWRQPYLLQIHLAGEGRALDLLAQTIGAALTHEDDEGPDQPGYQTQSPANEEQLAMWRAHLRALDFCDSGGRQADRRLARFPYLAGLQEALAVLRWPYPPSEPWPDVHFR
jgi:hypothetical protein